MPKVLYISYWGALEQLGQSLVVPAVKKLAQMGVIGKYRSTAKENSAPIHRNEAAFALNETFSSSPWRRFVKSTINQGLSFLKLGDGIKVWAIKK